MKVIVINDDDGHCTVLRRTPDNLRKLAAHLEEIGRGAYGPGGVKIEIPSDDDALEDWFHTAYVLDRSAGGQLYFLEVEDVYNFPYGPFG
jgi:hypothetical protein